MTSLCLHAFLPAFRSCSAPVTRRLDSACAVLFRARLHVCFAGALAVDFRCSEDQRKKLTCNQLQTYHRGTAATALDLRPTRFVAEESPGAQLTLSIHTNTFVLFFSRGGSSRFEFSGWLRHKPLGNPNFVYCSRYKNQKSTIYIYVCR